MSEPDFDQIRKHRRSKSRDEKWPTGVYAISIDGVSLLGIHEDTDKLYWDGREVVTKRVVSLGSQEKWLAWIVALSTVGMFITSVIAVL
jgi:hypothetical protein